MKSVLISIRPKWCDLIASGKKTIEVRKTKPRIETPFKCYIYECNWKENTMWSLKHKGRLGKVIGEFTCNQIRELKANNGIQTYFNGIEGTCLRDAEIIKYASGKTIYYWHISDLVIYDKQKELSEFQKSCSRNENCCTCNRLYNKKFDCIAGITRPPQSWCYVEESSDENP